MGTVGNNHINAGVGSPFGGNHLGQHAAGPQRGTGTAGQSFDFGGDLFHHGNQPGVGVAVGIGCKQAVNVRKQYHKVGVDTLCHQCGQGIVVAQGIFFNGDGVVFVHDGNGTQLQQTFQRAAQVAQAIFVVEVLPGEQHLGHCVVVLAEQPVVGIHQFALSHGSGGLFGGDVFRLLHLQFAYAQTGGGRGNNNQFVAGVFDVAPYLDQVLGMADIQPPARMGEGAGADLHNDAHSFTSPISLFFRKLPGPRRSQRRGKPAVPAGVPPEW